MPGSEKSRKQSASTRESYSDEDREIARLLAKFESDRSRWDDDTVSEIANVRAMALFFCPVLVLLKRRGKTLERACRERQQLQSFHANRRPFNALASGAATTLETVLHVGAILNAIAKSRDAELRGVTQVRRHGVDTCLLLEEDDVIPSHIWVDGIEIRDFRDNCDITRKTLAEMMFGKAKYEAFFQKLEEGERVAKRKKKDGKPGKVIEYDYRVTPYTRERIEFTFAELVRALAGRFEDKDYAGPSAANLFSTSHRAGLGAYNRARALPMSNGNATRPMGDEERLAISDRVRNFANGAPKTIARRVRLPST